MRIQWTMPLIKSCAEIYSTLGVEAAMRHTGASRMAVFKQMAGVKCGSDSQRGLVKRKYYAEEISNIFEMLASGISYKLIAEYYDTTDSCIRAVVSIAKKHGFDAYPKRNENEFKQYKRIRKTSNLTSCNVSN